MRVLVATSTTNGDLPGDYDFCLAGELVYMMDPCAWDRRDPDGGCGCGRGFAGSSSHRATTTAQVVETDLSEADVRLAFRASLQDSGWLPPGMFSDAEQRAIVNDFLAPVCSIAEEFPVGSAVRRRLDDYYVLGQKA